MPGFPGAAWSSVSDGLCASCQASACSRAPEPTRSTFTRRVYSGRFRNDHLPGGGRFPDGVALPISVATLFPTRGQPLGARAAAFRCVPVPGKRTFSSDVIPFVLGRALAAVGSVSPASRCPAPPRSTG